MTRILVLTLLLFSCKNPPKKEPQTFPTGIHSDFIPYLNKYEHRYGASVRYIPINYGSIKAGRAAECAVYTLADGGEYRFITIDKKDWDYMTNNQRLGLIFHEMGHCHLNKDHDNRISEDECPMSFMYKNVFSDECIVRYKDYYIEEMFL